MSVKNLKEVIRNEYVHGYINALGQRVMPTLDELIAKYKVPSSTVYRTSSKDKWKDQRNAFRDKLRKEIDLQKTEELQGKLFKSDEISAEIAHEIFAKIKELPFVFLMQLEQFAYLLDTSFL